MTMGPSKKDETTGAAMGQYSRRPTRCDEMLTLASSDDCDASHTSTQAAEKMEMH